MSLYATATSTITVMNPVGIIGFSLLCFHTITLALFFQGTRALQLGGSSKSSLKPMNSKGEVRLTNIVVKSSGEVEDDQPKGINFRSNGSRIGST
jgi:hypothetical protein